MPVFQALAVLVKNILQNKKKYPHGYFFCSIFYVFDSFKPLQTHLLALVKKRSRRRLCRLGSAPSVWCVVALRNFLFVAQHNCV